MATLEKLSIRYERLLDKAVEARLLAGTSPSSTTLRDRAEKASKLSYKAYCKLLDYREANPDLF